MRALTPAPIVDAGPSTGWVFGCCLAAFCLGFSTTSLFELIVYDVPELATWWYLDALVGALAAWLTLMAQAAVRLRIDHDGAHLRTLPRRRHWPWSEIDEVDTRPPRIPLVNRVLAFRTGDRWQRTPMGLNTHPGGAQVLVDLARPVAQQAGVEVAARAVAAPAEA